MKNKKRIEILLKILVKSDQIIDNIMNVAMQMNVSPSELNKHFDESPLLAPNIATTDRLNKQN